MDRAESGQVSDSTETEPAQDGHDWSDISIDPDGKLCIQPDSKLPLQPLIAEVIDWSKGQDQNVEDSRFELNTSEAIVEARTAYMRERTKSLVRIDQGHSEEKHSPRARRKHTSSKSAWLVPVVAAVFLGIVSLLALPLLLPSDGQEKTASGSKRSRNKDLATRSPQAVKPNADLPTTEGEEAVVLSELRNPDDAMAALIDPSSDSMIQIASLDEVAESSVAGEIDSGNAFQVADSVALPDSPSAGDDGASQTLAGRDANSGDSKPLNAEGTDSEQDVGMESDLKDAESVDVMSALESIADNARSESGESEIEADEQQRLEPIQLPTFPMLQVQKVPPKLRVRAREPSWRLQLQASEGFEIKPSKAQTITGREFARWTIQAEDAEDESAQIYVQAQMVGSRGTSLRWQIAVGARDLPQVFLPISQKYLDFAQKNLAQFQIRLRGGIEFLKVVGQDAQGGARSAISAQRKSLENQLELATRVLEVVSEANQLEGWLDGQLEVNAEFVDVAQTNSPALLQFGSFASGKPGISEKPSARGGNQSGDAGDKEAKP